MKTLIAGLVLLLGAALPAAAQVERWDKDNGKPAPRLLPAGWVGTPVSLDALRRTASDAAAGSTQAQQVGAVDGNTVVIAFWNADIPC